MSTPAPLFDCRLDAGARRVINPVLASGALAAGAFVGELESRLDAYIPGRSSIAVSDMTQALAMALRLSGIGPGDDVLTLAVNCMSSNSAIALAGAKPVWVDVDPQTLTVDLADCEKALTANTKAMIIYHVAGYPADLELIEAFCGKHRLVFIEDANAALGAVSAGRKVGTGGRFSVLSFYANRQVNAIEGAALLCADQDDAERARRLRRFGVDLPRFRDADGEIAADADVPEIGFPASMSNVNAALACYHMNHLEDRLKRTRSNADVLAGALRSGRVQKVTWRNEDEPAFWTFFVRAPDRDGLMQALKAKGINCSKLHQRNDRYGGFAVPRRTLPGTTIFEHEMLALPVGWWLTASQLKLMKELLQQWKPRSEGGQFPLAAASSGGDL